MAEVHFKATLDTSELDNGLKRANISVGNFSKNIKTQGANIERELSQQFKRAALRLTAYGGIFAGIGLIKQIVQVRGEFQQLQIAFETMLDSKEKADRIMAESITLAQKTPFTLMEVTTNAKQLMAMGVAYKDVMTTLKSLGDVAAGVSVPLSRIAINYGQVITLGRLQQREIRDFAMAGVPIIDELTKNLGKTKEEIMKMVSAGQIGAKDVVTAFQTMSSEGGKFYNLMEKQNASVTGQISNLVDKWQVMLNEIGKADEGFIYDGISVTSSLISNYKIILSILGDLVVLYGSYKTALMLINSVQIAVNSTVYIQEAKALSALISTESAARISKQGLTVGTMAYSRAVNVEIANELKSLQATTLSTAKKLAAGKLEVAARMEILALRKADLVAAENELALSNAGISSISKKTIVSNLNTASKAVNTATTNVKIATDELEILTTKHNIAVKTEETLATNINTASKTANFTISNMLIAVQNALISSFKKLKLAMLNNPFTVIAIAITAVGFAIYKLITADTELEKAEKKLHETLKKTREENDQKITDTNTLTGKIRDNTLANYEAIKAYDELIKRFEYFKKFSQEDIRKMTKEEWDKVLEDFNIYTDTMSAQKNYNDQLLKIEKIRADIEKKRKEGSFKLGLQSELNAALIILKKYADEVEAVSKREKEAIFRGMSKEDQIKENKSTIKDLEKQKQEIDFLIASKNKEAVKDVIGIYLLQQNADALSAQISKLEKLSSDSRTEEIKKNKEYYTTMRDDAEKILSQMEVTDIGFKKQKEIYTYAVKQLKQWDIENTKEEDKRKKAKKKLIEEVAEFDLNSSLKLQSKLLDIEDRTKNQKLDNADNIYKKQLADAEEFKTERLKLLNETSKIQVTELSGDSLRQYNELITNAEKIRVASIEKINKDSSDVIKNIMYQSTEAFLSDTEKQKKAINDKYDAWKQDLIDNNATQALFTVLEMQRQQEISTVYADKAYKLSEFYRKAFGDISKYGTASLEGLITKAQDLVDTAQQQTIDNQTYFIVNIPELDKEGKKVSETSKITIEEYRKIIEFIEKGKKQLEDRNPFKALGDQYDIFREALKNGNKEEIEDALAALSKPLQDSINLVSDWAGSIGDIFSSLDDDITDSINDIISATTDLAIGIAKLATNDISGVGDVLNSMSTMVNMLVSGQNDFIESRRKFILELKDLQKEINSLEFDKLLNISDSNIFINDYLKKIENAQKALILARNNFQNELYLKTDSIYEIFGIGKEKATLTEYLSSLKIKIGETKKEFLGITVGAKDVFGSLLEAYPLLINEDGTFNSELAKTILNLDGISDKTKLALESLIEYTEEAANAEEAINSAISSIVGNISGDLYNALKTAWDEGTDSFLAFKNSVSAGLEDIVSQLIFNAVFADSLQELQDKLKESLGVGGDKNVTDDIEEFYKNAPDLLTVWEESMKVASDMAAKAGLKNTSSSSTSGIKGQIERTVTEETASEWVGLVRREADDIRIVRDTTKIGIAHLVNIEKNTENTVIELKNAVNELKDINKNTKGAYSAGL